MSRKDRKSEASTRSQHLSCSWIKYLNRALSTEYIDPIVKIRIDLSVTEAKSGQGYAAQRCCW